MSNFCLPEALTKRFIAALKSGELDVAKLSQMSSEERRAAFAKVLGEEAAKSTNALFESKLLLKNQQTGLINWIKKLTGITPEVRRDMLAKVERLGSVLEPESEKAFLADLAEHRLGTQVSSKEAAEIAQLAKTTLEAKAKVTSATPEGSPLRTEAGASQVAFENYVSELKGKENNKLTIADLKANPVKTGMEAASFIGGLAKSMKATLDNSFLFRQGFKAMISHPKQWADNSVRSFGIIARQLGKKATSNDIVDGIKAEIYGRKNAQNGNYKKMGLDIGTTEEAFPTSLPEYIPLLGRLFKASEAAFSGTAYRLRADIADQMLKAAEKSGRDITDKDLLKSIGTYTNSLTGRGDLGRAEGFSKGFNNLFFSPKNFKSNLDFLTAHQFDKTDPFIKAQARKNLAKMITAVGGALATAKAINPASVDFDPRSSDFGKIKIGNTRVDVTAGMSSLITLSAREITQKSKSSTTGKMTQIDSGKFGAPTTLSVIGDFFTNKLAPAFSTGIHVRQGKDFNGNKMNLTTVEGIKNTANDLLTPLPISNAVELAQDPQSAGLILGVMLDGLGISTNTYSSKKK